jgi:hypothetical protein
VLIAIVGDKCTHYGLHSEYVRNQIGNQLSYEFIYGPNSFILSWDEEPSKGQTDLMKQFFENCERAPQDRPMFDLSHFATEQPKLEKLSENLFTGNKARKVPLIVLLLIGLYLVLVICTS